MRLSSLAALTVLASLLPVVAGLETSASSAPRCGESRARVGHGRVVADLDAEGRLETNATLTTSCGVEFSLAQGTRLATIMGEGFADEQIRIILRDSRKRPRFLANGVTPEGDANVIVRRLGSSLSKVGIRFDPPATLTFPASDTDHVYATYRGYTDEGLPASGQKPPEVVAGDLLGTMPESPGAVQVGGSGPLFFDVQPTSFDVGLLTSDRVELTPIPPGSALRYFKVINYETAQIVGIASAWPPVGEGLTLATHGFEAEGWYRAAVVDVDGDWFLRFETSFDQRIVVRFRLYGDDQMTPDRRIDLLGDQDESGAGPFDGDIGIRLRGCIPRGDEGGDQFRDALDIKRSIEAHGSEAVLDRFDIVFSSWFADIRVFKHPGSYRDITTLFPSDWVWTYLSRSPRAEIPCLPPAAKPRVGT